MYNKEIIVDGSEPARGASAVTKSDTADLTGVSGGRRYRGLYVGVAGDVKATLQNGDTVTFKNVPVGVLPVCPTRVWSTGTAASEMIALY